MASLEFEKEKIYSYAVISGCEFEFSCSRFI